MIKYDYHIKKGRRKMKNIMELALQKTIEQGGFTNNETVKGRYCVATGINETILPNVDELTIETLENYQKTIDKLGKKGYVLGTWINQDNGKVYLDTVELFEDYDLAMQKAVEREEIAIYDLLENKELRVK